MGPLWVISLFLGLSELTVGVATTQATGWVQGMLAIFAVAFPILVATAFFLILWRRPPVLYAPREFGGEVNVTEYVKAMDTFNRRSLEIVGTAVAATVESVGPSMERLGMNAKEAREILAQVADAPRRVAVNVDLTVFDPSFGVREFPVDHRTTVSDLLDNIWLSVSEHVPSYSFGELWALRDETSGVEFVHIGRSWARANLKGDTDYRKLSAVGISRGTQLKAYYIKSYWLRAGGSDGPD